MNSPAPANDLRFLIVDPLAGVQSFARQLLESYGFASAAIRCAADPDSALALARDFAPDILITDWFADSAMTGILLHQRVCEQQPGCRLALLSFKVGPEQQAAAEKAGSRFLLRKPFTPQELQDTLRNALAKLAIERPELHQRFQAVAQKKVPAAPPRPIELPQLVSLRPGDKVIYSGKTDTVQHVVISHGELVVQLKGVTAMVPASKLKRV